MAFNAKEYEEALQRLKELKKDEGFSAYAEKRKAEKSKYAQDATAVLNFLRQKRYDNATIAAICGKARWLAVKADMKDDDDESDEDDE